MIRDSFRKSLKSELQTLLDADKEALKIWIDSKCRMAEMIEARPPVKDAAAKVVALGETATPGIAQGIGAKSGRSGRRSRSRARARQASRGSCSSTAEDGSSRPR